MKTNFKIVLFGAVVGLMSIASCTKDDDNTTTAVAVTKGVYVLNEGSWNGNNSSISSYDGTVSGTVIADYYTQQNGQGLGDTGNDLAIYGSKMYAVVNASNQVVVMSASNAKLVKSISFAGKQPRNIAFANGKAYVSSYDDTVCEIDTASLEITKTIGVGKDPEEMVVVGSKLYVCNGGGISGYDNKISVINLTTLQVENNITVNPNPVSICADTNGNLYVYCMATQYDSSYNPLNAALQKIDTQGSVSTISLNFKPSRFTLSGNNLYVVSTDKKIKVVSLSTLAVTDEGFIKDETVIKAIYGIDVDSTTGKVYITDALNYSSTGFVYCFGSDGKLEYKKSVGVSPNKVVFYRQ